MCSLKQCKIKWLALQQWEFTNLLEKRLGSWGILSHFAENKKKYFTPKVNCLQCHHFSLKCWLLTNRVHYTKIQLLDCSMQDCHYPPAAHWHGTHTVAPYATNTGSSHSYQTHSFLNRATPWAFCYPKENKAATAWHRHILHLTSFPCNTWNKPERAVKVLNPIGRIKSENTILDLFNLSAFFFPPIIEWRIHFFLAGVCGITTQNMPWGWDREQRLDSAPASLETNKDETTKHKSSNIVPLIPHR